MRTLPLRLIAGLCLLGLGTGCNPSKNAFQLGLPGTQVTLEVASVKNRGGILDAELQGPGWELRTFVVANEPCSAIFTRGQSLHYKADGAYGTFARDALRCDATGIGSLKEWRSKQPRADDRSGRPISSALASYKLVYEDEEVAFLRGNFPLAGRIGFRAMGDAIAVVPKIPICARAISQDTATLQYFQAGSRVLTLGGPDGLCEIVGLIAPPVGSDFGS